MLTASGDQPVNDEPIYNVRAVAQQTGLSAATLRAWERRYGFPAPQRTASGYRLYSSRDIRLLRWLKGQLERGLSISQAVALLSSLRASGQDPTEPGVHLTPAPASTQNTDELIADPTRVGPLDESAFEELLNYARLPHGRGRESQRSRRSCSASARAGRLPSCRCRPNTSPATRAPA
jgi:DNA-binding transcriptional MerR regulator